MKHLIQKWFNLFGYSVSKIETQERIQESFLAQQRLISHKTLSPIIFDVGAFHGEVSRIYAKLFPKAEIFSFEPFSDSYSILAKEFENISQFHVFPFGFSNEQAEVPLHVNAYAQTNSLLPTDEKGHAVWGDNLLTTLDTCTISVQTIDSFVEAQKIKSIDILKLDVQGAEFKVLEGAQTMLRQKRIFLIYMEIITMPTYSGQKGFDEVLAIMKSYGYSLYNLYNFSTMPTGQLRQVDAVFVAG